MARPDTQLVLAADIGGTRVRLGAYRVGHGRPIEVVPPESYPSRSAPDLETHVERFAAQHQVASAIHCACFGVAGPVIKGRAETTNLPWMVSETQLKKRFGWSRTIIINDLVAAAIALPVLKPAELSSLNQAESDGEGHLAVVAPGTGLGKALVAVDRRRAIPMASEGGHADFAPTNTAQLRLWAYLHHRFGHVSQERVLSGAGLVNIYRWLRDAENLPAAPAVEHALAETDQDAAQVVTENALGQQSKTCRQALDTFVEILGAVAGNWALDTLPWGGVYLGGGIAPKILSALRQGDFMASFGAKGRFAELMAKFPVRVILNDRAALLGAARWALMTS